MSWWQAICVVAGVISGGIRIAYEVKWYRYDVENGTWYGAKSIAQLDYEHWVRTRGW